MNDDPIKLLEEIDVSAQKICEVAKTANKNGKSLSADSFYGNKFHELTVQLAGFQTKFLPFLIAVEITPERRQEFDDHLNIGNGSVLSIDTKGFIQPFMKGDD